MALSRSAGSAIDTGRPGKMPDTRLLWTPRSESARTETGTRVRTTRLVDVLTTLEQQCPKSCGDRREHDVIHSSAESLTDRLHIVQARLRPTPAPVRPDRPVERRR